MGLEGVKKYKIRLLPPFIDQETMESLSERMHCDFGNYESSVESFESKFSKSVNSNSALALNSGTSALHMALLLLKVGAEDEILCPSFTFVATANAILYQGAKPVFIDSEGSSWNICPTLLENAILDRVKKHKLPKAVIVVHAYGVPAHLNKINEICDYYRIPLIEDAASALGSTYNNRAVGSFGEFGVFSFNYNKIITTAGGGMLTCKSSLLYRNGKYLATQAKSNNTFYEHKDLGYNYTMSGITAEIGNSEIGSLQGRVEKKRKIYDYYRTNLKENDGITFLDDSELTKSNRWLTTLLIEDKKVLNKICQSLTINQIEYRRLWNPMHNQPLYRNCIAFKNNTSNQLFEKGLCLPSGLSLTENDQDLIIEVINDCFK